MLLPPKPTLATTLCCTSSWLNCSCLVVECKYPGDLTDGNRTGNDFTYGNNVSFTCRHGYRLIGSSTRTCQASGTWSGSNVFCNGRYKDCSQIRYKGPK